MSCWHNNDVIIAFCGHWGNACYGWMRFHKIILPVGFWLGFLWHNDPLLSLDIYIYIFTNKLPRWILWCWHNDYTYISNSCYHFYHKDGCTCTICIQCIPCIFSPQAMASELNMYESQVNEYKYEIERLARELQDVKKKYFLSRKKEQQQKYVTTVGVYVCFSYLHVVGMILLTAWQPQIMILGKF